MLQTPSKGSFLTYEEPLENLLVAARAGNFNASADLMKRLFDMRYRIGNGISPTIVKLLDAWEFNHAFFEAFNNLFKYYKEENGCSIKTFLSVLLKHELIAEAGSSAIFQRLNTLSMDDERSSEEGEAYSLIDTACDEKLSESEVINYMDYVDGLERVVESEHDLPKMDRAIVTLRREGMTYEHIGKILSISITKARSIFTDFYNKVTYMLKNDGVSRSKKYAQSMSY